jgi:hypothetical protein
MVKLVGSALLVSSLSILSMPASAQRKASAAGPRQEIGADFTGFYNKPSGGSGGVDLGLPVDIRVGFLTHHKIMWEPRLSFQYSSGGGTSYIIVPGVNVLYQLKRGTGPYNLMLAPYVTGGAALNVFHLGGTGGSTSWTQLSLNGGVGKRVPFGSSATRFEGVLGYTFKGGGQASSFAIGTRIGLSFWH